MHVDVLGPMSINPEEQENITLCCSTAGFLIPEAVTDLLLIWEVGSSRLATWNVIKKSMQININFIIGYGAIYV